ncbi:MAG: type II secretion system F family protein, partial [Verrucomicrobiota bacterium]
MPQFQFTAADAKGEQTSGTVDAPSEAEAINQIKSQGYYPLQVVEAGKGTLTAPKKKAAKKKKAKKA